MRIPWTLVRVTAALAVGLFGIGCNTPRETHQVDHGSAGKESTITGCLTRGDQGSSFILRAENEPQPQGNERPERPTSSPNVYRLEARQDQDFASNVDARVKVTGYLETVPVHASGDANGELRPAPTSGANTTPQDQRTDMIDMKVFRVVGLEKLGSCQ